MFNLFKITSYFMGGSISVDGGREGDWLEDKFAKGGGVYDDEKISAYQTKSGRYKKDIWGKILFNMPDGTQQYYLSMDLAIIDWLNRKKYEKKNFNKGDLVVTKYDIQNRHGNEKKMKVVGFDGNYLIVESAKKASDRKKINVSPSDVVFYSDIKKYYAMGGSISVDGGREGDWLEDKFAKGGRITDAEINVGNRFGLPNGEVFEIKKRYIEDKYRGDDRIVVYTRSSDNREHESTLNGLKSFLNNWKAQLISKHNEQVLGEKYWTKYANGGLIEVVLNEGSGKHINKLYTEWNNIKSQKQWDDWAENVRGAKFGTYGTIGLLEIMENYGFMDSSKVSNLNKLSFIKEIKDALNSHKFADGGSLSEDMQKENTEFNLVRGKRFGQGKRVVKERVLNKYGQGGGVEPTKKKLHDAVLYRGELRYITTKEGVLGLVNLKSGAWGSDYPFIPLEKVNMDEVTDMVGGKVSIGKFENGGRFKEESKVFLDKVKKLLSFGTVKYNDYQEIYFYNGDNDDYIIRVYSLPYTPDKLENSIEVVVNSKRNFKYAPPDVREIFRKEDTSPDKIVDIIKSVIGDKKYVHGGSLSEDMQMAKSDVMKLDEYSKKISDSISPEQDVEAWVISKISKVEQTTANVKHTLEAEYPEMFEKGGEVEHTDGNTVRMMCLHIGKYAKSMLRAIDNGVEFESWMKHELSIAGSMIDSVFHYLDYFNSGNQLSRGGRFYMTADDYEDKLNDMSDSDFIKEVYDKLGIEISEEEASNERGDYIYELIDDYVSSMRSRGEKGFEQGGKMVRHFDIPNTLLDFTLKPKMGEGGEIKPYELGDDWSSDFDYDGMFGMALTVNEEWSVSDLEKLYDSFEDVNYHTAASPLWKAIKYFKDGQNSLGKAYLIKFKMLVKQEIADNLEDNQLSEGGSLAQRRKVGKVMREFKQGKLKTHGKVVTDRNQAIAIALSEAGLSKKEEGGIIESFKLPSSDVIPLGQGGIPTYNTPLDHWDLYYEKGGKIKDKN